MLSSETPSRRARKSRSLSVLVLPQFSCFVFVLLFAIPPSSAQPAPALGTTIERVMAVVDGHPLLLSEVNDLCRLRGLEPAAGLEAAIDERLMFFEASRLTQTEVLADEEERALAELLERRPILREQVGEPGMR